MTDRTLTRKSAVAICAVFSVALIFSVIRAYANRISIGYTDSAGFMELISKSGLTKPLESVYFSSSTRLFSLYGESSQKICDMIPEPYTGTRSVFSGHPYFISVFGSAISWITRLPPNVVAAFMLVGSFLLGFYSILFFLIKNNVSVFSTAVFGFTICCYPVLTQSLLGQPYFDRLIFGPAISLFLLIWSSKYRSENKWILISVLTTVLALISERGAALAGLLSFGYLLMLHGKSVFIRKELLLIWLSGLFSLLFLIIWSQVWQDSAAYSQISVQSWLNRLESLFSEPYFDATKLFFVVSASFMIIAIFAGRGFVLLIIATAPNLLIGVGGAELNGFVTHYHQVYLPILLAASTLGFTKIAGLTKRMIRGHKSNVLNSAFVLVFAGISLGYNFNSTTPYYRVSALSDAQALWLPFTVEYDLESRETIFQQRIVSDFVAGVGVSPVSAPESMYPALLLSGVEVVEYWPFGVGSARVVVAPYMNGLPNVLPHSDPQGSTLELQQCVQTAFDENYELIKVFDGDIRVYLRN